MLNYSNHEDSNQTDRVAIMAIGGAAGNILDAVDPVTLDHCSLNAVNLDLRKLHSSAAGNKIHIGDTLTHGLGSGGDPEIAERAVEESHEEILSVLKGNKLVILLAGLGAGTGSGATPAIARMAKEAGIFTISVITMPFLLEGKRRKDQALEAREKISLYSDIVLCFENDRVDVLLKGENKALAAFEASNSLLARVISAIPMLATRPGLFNIGLDDLKAVVGDNSYHCLFGYGVAEGEERALNAATQAMECPLFNSDKKVRGRQEVLIHVSSGESLTIPEIETAVKTIAKQWVGKAQIHFGFSIIPEMGDKVQVMAFAPEFPTTGLEQDIIEPRAESVVAPSILPIPPAVDEISEPPAEQEEDTLIELSDEEPEPEEEELDAPQEPVQDDSLFLPEEEDDEIDSVPDFDTPVTEETYEEEPQGEEDSFPVSEAQLESIIEREDTYEPSYADENPGEYTDNDEPAPEEEEEEESVDYPEDGLRHQLETEPEKPAIPESRQEEQAASRTPGMSEFDFGPSSIPLDQPNYDDNRNTYEEPPFKSLFGSDDPFILDGENLDLPPSLRGKK